MHQGNGEVGVSKPYQAGNFFRFTPTLIVGGSGQRHLNPTPAQTRSDNEKTLIYGQLIDEWRFGPDDLYLDLKHNLRYKFLGPDDLYECTVFAADRSYWDRVVARDGYVKAADTKWYNPLRWLIFP